MATYNFLPDKPLSNEEAASIEFGYGDIAESLKDMVMSVPTPYTIGMFGKWGSGKSTIIGQLKNALDAKQTIFLYFDIWKYESDALRRSFLMDVTQQLINRGLLDRGYIAKLEERLYIKTQSDREELSVKPKKLYLAAASAVVTFVITQLIPLNFTIASSVATSILIAIITFFRDILKNDILMQQISVTEDSLTSPEQFNREFEKLLSEKKVKSKRLLVVIDNLDRVQKDKTIELLGTVKTYLSSDSADDDIVFVIACDDKAIKQQIKAIFNEKENNEFSSDEYLRKFFNASIRIPHVLNIEIDTYTGKLLEQTGYEAFQNQNVRQIINLAFKDNPREIKQFINDLLAYCLLADKRSKTDVLEADFIEKNIEFITKLHALRQKYTAYYEMVEHRAVKLADTWADISNDNAFVGKDVELKTFLDVTEWATPHTSNLSMFFTLRRSDEDRSLPGWDSYLSAALSRQYENAEKVSKDFDLVMWNAKLVDYAHTVQSNKARYLPFIATAFSALRDVPQDELSKFNGFFNFVARQFPAGADLANIIDGAEPSFIFPRVYENTSSSYQKNISDNYARLPNASNEDEVAELEDARLLIDQKSAKSILLAASTYPQYFSSRISTQGIREALTEVYQDIEYLEMFIKPELQEQFLTKDVRKKFVQRIDDNALQGEAHIKIFDFLNRIKLDDLAPELIVAYDRLVVSEHAKPQRAERADLVNALIGSLAKIEYKLNDASKELVTRIVTHLAEWYGTNGDWVFRLLIVKAIYRIHKFANVLYEGQPLNPRISNFIETAPFEQLSLFVEEELFELEVLQDSFVAAIVRDIKILNLGDISKLEPNLITNLVSRLLDKARGMGAAQERTDYYTKVYEIIKEYPDYTTGLVAQFYNDLLSLKPHNVSYVQSIGRKVHNIFNADQRKQLRD